jgi:A/G-specific adenine glycosylase
LSEIILQQTRVEQGLPYWQKFMTEFPSVQDLANASQERVLQTWSGLGYYSRARNLHRAAQLLAALPAWPEKPEEWQQLPGVGPYTAAAITSICFGARIPALDGNAFRVYSRLFAYADPVDKPAAQRFFLAEALDLLDSERPGDSNQAIMDIGSHICTPTQPTCEACPLQAFCEAHRRGTETHFPVKTPKKAAKKMEMPLYVLMHQGHVAVLQRPQRGIWAGLWCFPETPVEGIPYQPGLSTVHLLSHRKMQLAFYEAQVDVRPKLPDGYAWLPLGQLGQKGIPVPIRWWLQEKNYI